MSSSNPYGLFETNEEPVATAGILVRLIRFRIRDPNVYLYIIRNPFPRLFSTHPQILCLFSYAGP